MTRIVIQAGHCHRKTNSVGTQTRDGGFTEQQFTWAVANRAAEFIRADGHDGVVILADPPSSSYRGDVFVAVHADGNNSPNVGGASVGYRTNEGKALAHAWKAAYKKLGWTGGFRGDNYTAALGGYYGVKRAIEQGTRRACILEFGFLTNPTEAAELRSPAGQERSAKSIRCAAYASLGISPTQEDDMPITRDDAKLIADEVWMRTLSRPGVGMDAPATLVIGDIFHHARKAAVASGADVDEIAIAQEILAHLDADKIAAAIPDDLAEQVANVLAERLKA